MKKSLSKIVALCFVATSLFCGNAFAKTEKGFTVGAGITHNDVDYNVRHSSIIGGGTIQNEASIGYNDSSIGYSLNAKYNFPDVAGVKGLYLAPSIFYEDINSSVVEQSSTVISTGNNSNTRSGLTYSVNNRSGLKVDLGYDVMDEISAYVSLGVATVDYEIDFSNASASAITNKQKTQGRDSSEIIAIGLNYEFMNDWLLNLEYSRQQFHMDALAYEGNTDAVAVSIGSKIQTTQLGLAYRF